MTILSDRQIKNLCSEAFSHTFIDRNAKQEDIYYPLTSVERDRIRNIPSFGRHDARPPLVSCYCEDPPSFKREPMIKPYASEQVRRLPLNNYAALPIISFGTSSFGYDVRLSDEFKIFSNVNSTIIDPKSFDEDCLIDGKVVTDDKGTYVILPPNSYLLGRTVEYFNIPSDIMVVAVGKSTYARCGAIVNVTPIEPGFKGNVVIEISNATTSPMKIYAYEGVAQFLFFKGSETVSEPYGKDRKYYGQTGITLPKV